jgi:hypothetical protein
MAALGVMSIMVILFFKVSLASGDVVDSIHYNTP